MSGLSKATFDSFRKLVYEKSGISLGPQKEALVSARVGKRMRALQIERHDEYLKYVMNDESGRELVEMLDAISTNTTSFFREPEHFTLLSELLEKWRQQGQHRFRVWCAAASSGEEPYTIAMTLCEHLDPRTHDIKILATDISTRVLEQCRVGVYTKDKIQTIPPALRERFFSFTGVHETAEFTVKDSLRRLISFRRLNLSQPPFPMKGPFDVIMCRNVMIYFDNRVRTNLIREAYRLLRPGGYLMVGHAESLTGIATEFRTICPSVYVK